MSLPSSLVLSPPPTLGVHLSFLGVQRDSPPRTKLYRSRAARCSSKGNPQGCELTAGDEGQAESAPRVFCLACKVFLNFSANSKRSGDFI